MRWAVAILVAVVTGLSGLEPLGAVLVGGLSGWSLARLDRAEKRINELERAGAAKPLDELSAAVRQPSEPAADEADVAAESLPASPLQAEPRLGVGEAVPPAPRAATEAVDEGAGMAWTIPSVADLERLFAGRLLAVVGGLALVIGAVLFLGLAFSRGWIGAEMRVSIGLGAGVVAFAIGSVLVVSRQPVVGHVLLAVGLGAVNVALFAATRLYEFVPPEAGLLGALVTAAAAAVVALRVDSQVVAAYGLVAVLAAPPVMGASATLLTLAFLGVALIGTTALAVVRDWRWLPPAGFVLTAPQLALYLTDAPPAGIGLAGLTGFWVLHAIAASGEELRRRSAEPSLSSATVLLGAAGLLVWGGFEVLDGDLERWRGPYLAIVALAHIALGGFFLRREHDRHAFSLMALGTGIAAVTMAVPIQLGGPPVPIVWSAEAAALAWVATERRHPYSAGMAVLLGALAIGHLVAIEYPLDGPFPPASAIPFVSGRGGALGFVLGAIAVAGWMSRDPTVRCVLGGVGVLLVAYAVPFELTEPLWRMVAWMALSLGTLVITRGVVGLPAMPPPGSSLLDRDGGNRLPYLSAAFIGFLALGTLVVELLPITELPSRLSALERFGSVTDAGTVGGIVAAVAVAAVGFGVRVDAWRAWSVVGAASIGAYAVPYDLPAGWTAVGWAGIGIAVTAVHTVDAQEAYRVMAGALAALAAVLVLAVVMPLDRLVVDGQAPTVLPIVNVGSVAVLAIVGLVLLLWVQNPDERPASAGVAAGAMLVVYGLSVGVVDTFAVRVGQGVALEELQKQAQTALSVLLATLGGVGLVAGLWRRVLEVRLFGLGLLALATAKVFLIDLATLDVAYRVVSFIGLGLLLLASAWVFFRLQSADETPTSGP